MRKVENFAKRWQLSALLVLGACCGAATCGTSLAQSKEIVVISDLHFGVGHIGDQWAPIEDFRWPNALAGFLEYLDATYKNGVDLVIAGDLLELWQHPALECLPKDGECGCPVADIDTFAQVVIQAHADDLKAIGAWVDRGKGNWLTVVPGNHDAALMEPTIWNRVKEKIGAVSGRVKLATSGVWTNEDKTVVVEHGHQITFDVNSYPNWPNIRATCNGGLNLYRPWGELFVETLYTRVEMDNPIIDNLLPESAGVTAYSDQVGFWESVADAARFAAFNIFQTSVRQKSELGKPQGSGAWDVTKARELGYRLFANAMDPRDPLREVLMTESSPRAPKLNGTQFRAELDRMVQTMDRSEILAMCDQIEVRRRLSGAGADRCSIELGQTIKDQITPLLQYLTPRLAALRRQFPAMTTYIYGHTHQADFDINVPIDGHNIQVVNTGAFQRIADQAHFRAMAAAEKVSEGEALKVLKLEKHFKACYSVVTVETAQNVIKPSLQQWFMEETDSRGRMLFPCDISCSAIPPRCGIR